jgi:hypothetical protein
MITHNRAGERHLAQVISAAEAARIWHVRNATIKYHLDRGSLCGRKSGMVWLVTTASLIALYGIPPQGIDFSG